MDSARFDVEVVASLVEPASGVNIVSMKYKSPLQVSEGRGRLAVVMWSCCCSILIWRSFWCIQIDFAPLLG